ncbi:Zn(2)-C6 fungal-type domain-containing protein [Mycena venus]|uniref:Zn(2)-C6 fungal-type domain-containing protein n=1 Tax=Mycena venus TaxID=2733690 RepID=A0A8H6YD19_9AGAR|nr:Zn(2)-C6 fungal-type domain-containing protein [Mycena venus]
MEATSSRPKPKRIRPPKPRTQPLKRGRACLNCRHLKIRCDGIHPVCGNCARVPKEEPCKFTDPLSKNNFNVGNDIAGSSRSPSLGVVDESPDYSSAGIEFSTPKSSFSEISSDAQSESHSNHSLVEEPSFETIQLLLQYFLPHAAQLGFFLHIDRFRNSALVPQIPFGDILRPSHSLLYAVYLWGAHLSQSGPLFDLKSAFLSRALQAISTETCVHRDSIHAIQTIQAHVLLANYFFLLRSFLAAQLHANAAATLVLGYRLHKLGSAPPPASSIRNSELPPFDAYLTPAQDSVEEGERVRCFWAVVSLQANLNLASDSPTSLSSCLLESSGTEIDTPWPMQNAEYELQPGYSAADNYGGEVIKRFLGDELSSIQIPVSHVQASVLLHRASRFAASWSSNLQPTELSSYTNCYTWLDRRISRFWDTLPPVYPSADPDLVLTHALVAAASIKLHQPFSALDPAAQSKCLASARAIIRFLGDTTANNPASAHHANPVHGAICALACRVLVDEIQRTRVVWAEWSQTLDVQTLPAGEQESMLLLNLQEGMRIMGKYAAGSPLAEHQLAEIQRQYNSHYEIL